MMKNLLISLVLSVFLVVTTVYAKEYHADNLVVVYDNPIDLKIAILGVEKARKFFEELGYDADYPVKLIFQEAIYLDILLLGSNEVTKHRVYGAYFGNMWEGEKNVIKVSSWGTDYLHTGSRDCFNIPVTLEFHATIVTHETAHLLLRSIAGKLGHGVNEYVAYTVQISTMSESLRKKILDNNKDVEPFGGELMINGMIHAHDPHAFGLMSYLDFVENGPDTFIKILTGKLDPDTMFDALFGG